METLKNIMKNSFYMLDRVNQSSSRKSFAYSKNALQAGERSSGEE